MDHAQDGFVRAVQAPLPQHALEGFNGLALVLALRAVKGAKCQPLEESNKPAHTTVSIERRVYLSDNFNTDVEVLVLK